MYMYEEITYLHFASQAFGYVLPSDPQTGLNILGHMHGFGHGHLPLHPTFDFLKTMHLYGFLHNLGCNVYKI